MFQLSKGLESINGIIKQELMLPPFTSISMQQAVGKVVQLHGIYDAIHIKD